MSDASSDSSLEWWKTCAWTPLKAFWGRSFQRVRAANAVQSWQRHADGLPRVCLNHSYGEGAAEPTWRPAFFLDAPHLRLLPTWVPPQELGQDHIRLPVTHQLVRGCHKSHHAREALWLYYAEGCSDLYYNVGRTLRARNKVEAALLIAQRAGRVDPAAHVASWLRQGPMRRGLARSRYVTALSEIDLSAVLRNAAAGPFQGADAKPRAASGPFCNVEFMRLSKVQQEYRRANCTGPCAVFEFVACLWLFEFLDDFLETESRRAGLDSLILSQSPQGGYGFFTEPYRWSIEILDVRAARLPSPNKVGRKRMRPTSAHVRSRLPFLSDRDGRSCEPTCWFDCCMACRSTPATLRMCANNTRTLEDVSRCIGHCTPRDAGGPEVLMPTNLLRLQAREEALADGNDAKLVERRVAATNESGLVDVAHAAWHRRVEQDCAGWLWNGRHPR